MRNLGMTLEWLDKSGVLIEKSVKQEKQRGQIGLSFVAQYFEPYSESLDDIAAARRAMDFELGWFVEPLVYGDYPRIMREIVKDRLPTFSAQEKNVIKGYYDFNGLNYYTSRYAKSNPINLRARPISYTADEFVNTTGKLRHTLAEASGYIYKYPQGLQKLLEFIKQEYQNPNIYITENGYTERRNDSLPVNMVLKDQHWIDNVIQHLQRIRKAIDEKVVFRERKQCGLRKKTGDGISLSPTNCSSTKSFVVEIERLCFNQRMRTYKRLRTNQRDLMAENQDRAENENVAENVNPLEAENLPVTGNVPENEHLQVTENIPQNENVVETEEASENGDLDQYLVHPRNTWAYDITITVHCKLKLIDEIKTVLADCGELDDFKESCFGHYLDMSHYMRGLFQAQYIHNLLLRQIRFPSANDDEMWFALGKTKVRLGKREFCLCTGLRFGVLPDIFLRDYVPVLDGIHIRYFGGDGNLLLADLLNRFLRGGGGGGGVGFEQKGDGLKMALVLFANNILFGQDYRRQVTYWLLSLVEDIEAFNLFPCGHYVFKMTLHYIRIGFKVPEPMGPARRYNLYGFIWGVQLTGLPEISHTRMEEKEDYWLGIDDDLSESPQFVPLKDLGTETSVRDGNETDTEVLMNQLKDGRTCEIHRGIPVEDPHSPVQHPSSGDNQRTSSPTRQRPPSPTRQRPPSPTRQRPPSSTRQHPPYHRTRHSSARIPSCFSKEDYAEHDDSDGEPAFQLNTGLGVYGTPTTETAPTTKTTPTTTEIAPTTTETSPTTPEIAPTIHAPVAPVPPSDDIHTPLPPSHEIHTPPTPSTKIQPETSKSGKAETSSRGGNSPIPPPPLFDRTERVRERLLSKWLRSPYTDPFRAQKKVKVAEQYTAFMNASGLLYRNIGIDACVSRSFFTVLEQPTAWLGSDHVDAYINLLCKRKQDPVQGQSFPRKDSLSSIWRKFQPNFHTPLPKPFYPKDFVVPTDLSIYAIGQKPAWGMPWADVDDVLVPYNVGDSHWVLCVVRLNDWVITIFDSTAHLQPNYPKYREQQVLPLRRLFPLICKASGYYDVSKRWPQNMNCMKVVRLAPHLFPCQTDGDSCGVFMLKGLEYVMMNKDLNFDFNQDNIPAFRKQMARDIFANSLPFH
ncbi:hypothetical protein Dsin_004986 [Dipteronia sinensis]|uniref:Ubiquitin-like protease family profile domain-containing protein n=1 Tax=Dipteronia sinensis TaxID=43782 RepID=A0AAE0AX24_9ROSI|nr:hypothetical protein Dsin_004986 [Dipteronia sinensis]